MIIKWVKRGVIVAAGALLIGGLVFGKDLTSYIRSSVKSTRMAIKDSVPTEFELQRAKDLLEDIIPEMHANIRLMAEEEVEIAALSADIPESSKRLAKQRDKIEHLSETLAVQQASYRMGERFFTRDEVKDDLARRFERFKEAELILASKERLLKARQSSLESASQILKRTRAQKALMEDRIAALEAQHRLIRAASVGSKLQVDNTKLAQAEKLIGEIKKRLDVSERVLAHEARFTEAIPIETVNTAELLAQVKEHFNEGSQGVSVAAATDVSQAVRQN